MVDYFLSIEIKHIWSDPLFPEVGMKPVCEYPEKLSSFHFDMERYVDTYIEARQYAEKNGVFYGSFLTCNFDGECNKHCWACIPMPYFTSDGYIFACDLVTFVRSAGHMDCFVYGKLDETKQTFIINNDKIRTLRERTMITWFTVKTVKSANTVAGTVWEKLKTKQET